MEGTRSLYLLLACFLQFWLGSLCFCPKDCVCHWVNEGELVNCTDKHLHQLPDGIDTEAQVLDFSGNPLEKLLKNHFETRGLIFLKELFLTRCSLKEINRHAFIGLVHLKVLDLSSNLLHEIPRSALAFTQSLTTLRMTHNPLGRIRSLDFSLAPSLVNVDVSHCEIYYVHPDSFFEMSALVHVNLSNNELGSINRRAAENLFEWAGSVDLYNNPWFCDCAVKPLFELLPSRGHEQMSLLTCKYPPHLEGKAFDSVNLDSLICPPKMSQKEVEIVRVEEGNMATFICHVKGDPKPQVTWYLRRLGHYPIDNTTRMNFNQSEVAISVEMGQFGELSSTLVIHKVMKRNNKLHFRCVAKNKGGVAKKLFALKVISQSNCSKISKPSFISQWIILTLFILLDMQF